MIIYKHTLGGMILVLCYRDRAVTYGNEGNLCSLTNMQFSINDFEKGSLRKDELRQIQLTVELRLESEEPSISISLLSTCRQIYSEAQQVLYVANRFRFNINIAFSTFTRTLRPTHLANIQR